MKRIEEDEGEYRKSVVVQLRFKALKCCRRGLDRSGRWQRGWVLTVRPIQYSFVGRFNDAYSCQERFAQIVFQATEDEKIFDKFPYSTHTYNLERF